jgi:hypothetical protein
MTGPGLNGPSSLPQLERQIADKTPNDTTSSFIRNPLQKASIQRQNSFVLPLLLCESFQTEMLSGQTAHPG